MWLYYLTSVDGFSMNIDISMNRKWFRYIYIFLFVSTCLINWMLLFESIFLQITLFIDLYYDDGTQNFNYLIGFKWWFRMGSFKKNCDNMDGLKKNYMA